MKKQNFSTLLNVVKKPIFSLGFTSLLLIGTSSAVSAQEKTGLTVSSTINYIGSLDGQPVFNVHLDNKSGDVYYLTIRDDEGAVLYSEKIREKLFSRKFKFDNADRNDVKLTFVLEGKQGTKAQEFKVNNSTKVLNDVVVTTL